MNSLTPRQQEVLDNVRVLGGEINRYAAQKGLNLHTLESLVRLGVLEYVPQCRVCAAAGVWNDFGCQRPLPHDGGQRCHNRVRVTDIGAQNA